jgi:hypothetical protein
MRNDQAPDHMTGYMKTLWQGVNARTVHMSPEPLGTEVERLQKGLRRRAVITCILLLPATIVVIAVLMWFSRGVPINTLERIALVLVILGSAAAFFRVLRLWPVRVTPDLGQTECIRFYRIALERERDSFRGWWLGCSRLVGPVGVMIFLAELARANSQAVVPTWIVGVGGLVFATWIVRFDRRMARMFQSRIDALDASFRRPSGGDTGEP